MNQENTLYIALCDDHTVVMQGFKSLIETLGNFEVSIMANGGQELIDKLEFAKTMPDVCILDVNMPGMSGMQTIVLLKKRWPDLKVLILSIEHNDNIIINMLKEGASGYLVKNCTAETLKSAIESVHENGVYFSEKVNVQFWNAIKKGHIKLPGFSEHELKIMRLCYTGMSYKTMAVELHVTLGSVKGARDNIFKKLAIHTRSELIFFAIQNGIIFFD